MLLHDAAKELCTTAALTDVGAGVKPEIMFARCGGIGLHGTGMCLRAGGAVAGVPRPTMLLPSFDCGKAFMFRLVGALAILIICVMSIGGGGVGQTRTYFGV